MPQKGCHSNSYADWNLTGVSMKSCPVQLFSRETNLLFKVVNDFEKSGVMPYSGGSLEQPCRLINAVDIVRNLCQQLKTSK